MKVNVKHADDIAHSGTVDNQDLTPTFYTHSNKTHLAYLSVVVDESGNKKKKLFTYLLQIDGKTGKLSLLEKQARPAPFYSSESDSLEDDDE